MTDRELLEMAAKAAWITKWEHSQGDDGIMVFAFDTATFWNPLTDDGDALRLAVKLGIAVRVKDGYATAAYPLPTGCEFHIPSDDDPYIATRRAIVRAAAEIGRRME